MFHPKKKKKIEHSIEKKKGKLCFNIEFPSLWGKRRGR